MLCMRDTSYGPLSVRLSVCLSQVGVLLKRMNVGSHKQSHTINQGLYFSDAKDLREIRPANLHKKLKSSCSRCGDITWGVKF